MKKVDELGPVSQLLNLGPRSVELLANVGIHNVSEFKEVGYLNSYLSVKSRYPRHMNRMALYAFYGALHDEPCIHLSKETKATLEVEMQDRIAEVSNKNNS